MVDSYCGLGKLRLAAMVDHREMAGDGSNARPVGAGASSRSQKRQTNLIRGLLALLGLALVGTGIAGIFTANSEAGAAALVGVGSLLVLFGAIGDQLESLRFGDLEFRLRREAEAAVSRGDLETAKALERAADALHQRVKSATRAYKLLRTEMPAGEERSGKMTEVLNEGKRDAAAPDLDEEDVLRLLWTGPEGARVWALGVLQERPELATPRAVLEAIQHPDQMFDQYHALLFANKFVISGTSEIWTLERVGKAVHDRLHSGALGADRGSVDQARQLLEDASQRIADEARKQKKEVKRPEWNDCPKCTHNGSASL